MGMGASLSKPPGCQRLRSKTSHPLATDGGREVMCVVYFRTRGDLLSSLDTDSLSFVRQIDFPKVHLSDLRSNRSGGR